MAKVNTAPPAVLFPTLVEAHMNFGLNFVINVLILAGLFTDGDALSGQIDWFRYRTAYIAIGINALAGAWFMPMF